MTPQARGPELRGTLLAGLVEEFLHNTPRGRRLVAVEGAGTADAARFADDFAEELTARGQPVLRVSVADVDEAMLCRDTVDPFRAGALPEGAARVTAGTASTAATASTSDTPSTGTSELTTDTVLVVDGRGLLDDGTRGIWHFSLWLLAGDELPHSGASVIVDLSDDAAPGRYFYDYCALPPSVNRPGLH